MTEELFAKALEVEKAFQMDPQVRREYQKIRQAEIDYKADMAAAEQKGVRKNSLDVARRMLKINIPLDQIAQISQLSMDQLRQLQAQSEPEFTN